MPGFLTEKRWLGAKLGTEGAGANYRACFYSDIAEA
jgi:hypothetical protein